MIRTLQQMTLTTLSMIFLSSCGGLPKVTLYQIDSAHNRVNARQITKYNKQSCSIEVQKQPSFPLIGNMQGAICVSAKDFEKLKAHAKGECEGNQDLLDEAP